MSNSSVKIMAIINTSPDSFAGDGLEVSDETALEIRIRTALDEGADLLDIGGQSTRPGADVISADEEIKRTIPAIKLARRLTDRPISIDTFKPDVAKEALAAGADIVNDVRGASNPELVKIVREAGCRIVIMHSRGDSKTMGTLADYPNGITHEICEYLQRRAQELIEAGIAKENIIVDPGIGFAKTAAQSLELTAALDKLVALGYPVLYGASQKSFLGKIMGGETNPLPLEQRLPGTRLVQAYAILQGAAIIRVHGVQDAVRTREMIVSLTKSSERY